MSALAAAVLWVGGALLVVSGIAKLRDGDGGRAVLAALRLPPGAVVAVAAAEVALGASAVVEPRPPVAAAVSGLYLLFALVVERLRRLGTLGSCGCLGSRSAPPSRVHVALDVMLAAGAAAAAATGPVSGLLATAAARPLLAPPLVAGVAAATALAAAAVEHLPPLLRSSAGRAS